MIGVGRDQKAICSSQLSLSTSTSEPSVRSNARFLTEEQEVETIQCSNVPRVIRVSTVERPVVYPICEKLECTVPASHLHRHLPSTATNQSHKSPFNPFKPPLITLTTVIMPVHSI